MGSSGPGNTLQAMTYCEESPTSPMLRFPRVVSEDTWLPLLWWGRGQVGLGRLAPGLLGQAACLGDERR